MDPGPVIRSRANPLLKRVGAVAAGRERDVLLLEGERLVRESLAAGLLLDVVLLAEHLADSDLARDLARTPPRELRLVEPELLARVSALETSPGILALAPPPPRRVLEHQDLLADALLLVAAGVADPGNLGALARSAEAAGAAGLVVLAGGASPWRPKALRGSMGSLLRLPVLEPEGGSSPSGTLAALATQGFRSVRAEARDGAPFDAFDWSGRIALWVAGETRELPPHARAFESVTIPMAGAVESLNVTVAASLLLFAAGRARAPERAR